MFLLGPFACLITLVFWIPPLYADRLDCYTGFDSLPAFSYLFVVTAFNKCLHMDSNTASASSLHPPELYLEILDLVGSLMLNSFNFAIEHGVFHRDQKT